MANEANSQFQSVPFFIRGGIGLHTAAASVLSGASGIVLDQQLLLARESTIPQSLKQWISAADGSESRCIGESLGLPVRIIQRPKSDSFERLNKIELEIEQESAHRKPDADSNNDSKAASKWQQALVSELIDNRDRDAFLLGPDIATARRLAESFVTVGGIIDAIKAQVVQSLNDAAEFRPLIADSPFAQSHQTDFPFMQGPMTRVSDTPEFAKAIADGGALPFLALAVMRGAECDALLAATKPLLSDQSWGVGLLGFLQGQIRADQTKAVLKHRPPFAIIAGGRPDQAKELEDAGIETYLHVPSPGLLKMFLRDGATRFIFEGRECGGHVGPRSSFILWESMVSILVDYLDHDRAARGKAEQIHVAFAGGIHDALSSGMVSAIAAPLARRGVKIGGLMGTAYLFTKEAVDQGAIVPNFQKQAVDCDDTVLLQTGPGHAIRCVKTPYFDLFESEKQRLEKAGKSHQEIVQSLERMNIGRLRVASKGLDRAANAQPGVRKLEPVSDQDQFDRGMYMIGQVAGMRNEVTTIRELHEQVCDLDAQRNYRTSRFDSS